MGRMERVNQQLKREIGRILQQEMSDPRLEFVSIMEVKTSNDLKTSRVYFSVLDNAHLIEDVQNALKRASGFVRKQLGAELNMRYTPQINFIYDETIETSARIEDTIRKIHNES